MDASINLAALFAPATKATKATKRVWTPLTAAEAKTAASVARPAEAACLCGCGSLTKGRFTPGHDATHKARLAATVAAGGAAAKHATEALATFGW